MPLAASLMAFYSKYRCSRAVKPLIILIFYANTVSTLEPTFSIHVPRGGHDPDVPAPSVRNVISIHVPRGGHDFPRHLSLSTRADFNPRAPWGARLDRLAAYEDTGMISIHVPRGGHDVAVQLELAEFVQFQSTCPVGGTTRCRSWTGCREYQSQSTCPVGGTTAGLGAGVAC